MTHTRSKSIKHYQAQKDISSKIIKAWVAIRTDTGLPDSFDDIRATKTEAKMVAIHRAIDRQYTKEYKVVPVEIHIKVAKK